ncbi:hypothetical protein ABPG75_003995 [Micractinium tetrahymenae]
MDLLLTPLVTRLLKQYVKRSSEGAGRDLKVSFSRGNVLTLHNLELNLAPLLGGAAALAHVRRAFARRLSITIPWTALTTQPIQVVLDTVELVLAAAEQALAPTPSASTSGLSEVPSRHSLASATDDKAAAASDGGGGGGGGAGWFGSAFQSMALRAGLNVTVKLTNVVAKWVEEGQFVAAATFQELLLQTITDDWAKGLRNPEAWLKKECNIKQLSISLDQHAASAEGGLPSLSQAGGAALPAAPGPAHSYRPLLRIANLGGSALLPAFAWLEGADLAGDPFNTSVQVHLAPLHVAVNDRQLRWAGSLVALMQAAAAAKQAAAEAEEAAASAAAAAAAAAAVGTPSKAAPGPAATPDSPAAPAVGHDRAGSALSPSSVAAVTGAAAPASAARPQAKALGVFGRVWDFLIDEASYVEVAEGTSPKARPGSPAAPAAAAATGSQPSLGQQQEVAAAAAPLAAVPMYAELQVLLEGLHVAAGVVVDRRGQAGQAPAAAGITAGVPAGMSPRAQHQQPQQQAPPGAAPDLEETLCQLREATANNNVEVAAALQQQLAAALAGRGAPTDHAQAHLPAFEVHPCAELHLQRLQVAVASVDASISGVAVELQQLTLRRSTAAAPLLTHILSPSGGAAVGQAEQRALSAAAAAAGSSAWVEVLSLEPEQPLKPPSPRSQQQAAQTQLAVSVHYFDSAAGPGSALPSGAPAPGQLRCSIALGRVLLAHAPGFVTNMLLLAKQYPACASGQPAQAAAAASALDGSHAGGLAGPTGAEAEPAGAAEPATEPGLGSGGGSSGSSGSGGSSGAASTSLLAQALQPQLLLECRVAQLELLALASQAPEAAALALLLRQLELRSGALNWEAPWNSRLRHALLAPPPGFGGHGLRFGLAAAELAVADGTAAASGDCGGLWQLQRAAAVSNVMVLDAVLAEAPVAAAAAAAAAGASASGPDASSGAASGGLLASAALSLLQLQLSGEQAAAVAACVGGTASEASARFAASLLPLEPPVSQQQGQPAAWLASASLSIPSGLQLAYAAAGGLRLWRDPHGSAALSSKPGGRDDASGSAGSSASSGPELFLGLGSITASLAASPAAAAAAVRAPQVQPPLPVLLQLQLLQAHAWVLPQLAVHSPVAEARLGSAAQRGSAAMLPEPLLLLAALSYSQQLADEEQEEGGEQPGRRVRQRRSVQLASLSLAVSPSDYSLLLELLRCWRQQPALAVLPALRQADTTQQQQQAQQQVAAEGPGPPPRGAAPAEQLTAEEESELSVQVGAASVTLWPQPAPQQQYPQQGHVVSHEQGLGMAFWLSSAHLRSHERTRRAGGSSGSGSSSQGEGSSTTEVSLGSMHAALLRQRQPGGVVDFSPVLSFPDATAAGPQPLQQQQREQPALSLVLSSSWCSGSGRSSTASLSPGSRAAASGRRLQLHAAPLSLAVSKDLMSALGALRADLHSTQLPPSGSAAPQQAVAAPQAEQSAAPTGSSPEGLQGKAALEGLRLMLLETAAWEDRQAGAAQQPARATSAAAAAAGWQPAPGTAAAAVMIEEAIVLLQQAPAADNRPWLAGSHAAGALLTSVDASLIGAAITVWHAGQPGADATALLPPTDGRLQLLLQPHTGAVAVAAQAQLLPLQVSLPAVEALTAVISAVSSAQPAEEAEVRKQQQAQHPAGRQLPAGQAGSPSLPAPSPAVVAAATTVIIEDASATLEAHRHCRTASLVSAAAELEPGSRGTAAAGSGSPLQHEHQHQQQCGADDLSAALFTFVHSSGGSSTSSRPGPLQVQALSGNGGEEAGGEASRSRGLGSRLGARLFGRAEPAAHGGEDEARRHGIRFCYPQPREVALLAVEDAPAALLAAAFQLSCYSPADEAYLPLPLQAVMLDSIGGSSGGAAAGASGSAGGSGKVLLLFAEECFAAAGWEVLWELPAGSAAAGATAADVLQRLRVNPRACSEAANAAAGLGRQLRLPPPLAASLTVALTAESGSLALLAPTPLVLTHGQQHQQHQQEAVALLDTAAMLHAGGLKLAVHTYPAPEGCTLLAADLQAALALCLAGSSSATSPATAAAAAAGWAVVEPFQLDATVEYSSLTPALPHWQDELRQQAQQQQQQQARELEEHQEQQEEQPLMFWQAAQHQLELPLLVVRAPPVRQGLAVQLAAQQQPVVLNASEDSLAEVKRLISVLSGPASDAASGDIADGGVAAAAATAAPATAAPLLLVNRCGLGLWVRQEGTQQQHLLLQEGQRLPMVWPAPPALVPGATRRLQMALAAAGEDEAAWSNPVDVMAAGGQQLVLPTHGNGSGGGSSIAVQVRASSSGSGWEVLLLPALRVDNRLSAPVHVCLSRDGGIQVTSPGGSRARAQQQNQTLEVPSGGSAQAPLHGSGTQLRLWLGGDVASGTGWSQAIPLLPWHQQHGTAQQKDPVLMVLHSSPAAAATALAAGVRSPTAPWAAAQQLGAVLAQMVPPDAATGQSCIRFWPPLLLRNATPCPLRLLLPLACAQQAQQGTPAAQQQQGQQEQKELLLMPGDSHQLTVPLHGGTVGALLALEAGCSGSPAAAAVGHGSTAAAPRGLPVVVPPLIAESAEQQWFGRGGPKPAAGGGDGAAPAVYIATPQEATWLRLPLLVAGPGGPPAAGGPESTGGSSATSSSAPTTDCLLVTQQHAGGLPLLQLTLQPALVVHNCLPVPLLFQVPAAAPVEVPAGWSLPLPAGRSPSGGAADEAVVLLPLAGVHNSSPEPGEGQPGQQQLLLRSRPFRLEPEGEDGSSEGGGSSSTHLVLATEPPPAQRSSSGLWRTSSAAATGAASPRLECRLAARVEVQQHSAAGGSASAAAVSVAISAGCFVSNLTGLPLAMLAEGAAAEASLPATAGAAAAAAGAGPNAAEQQHAAAAHGDSALSPQGSALSLPPVGSIGSTTAMLGAGGGSGSAARQGTLLPHAATVPLLHLWHASSSRGARAQRQGSWGSTSEMLRSFSGGLLPSSMQHASGAPGAAAAGKPALRFALVADGPAPGAAGSAAGGSVDTDSDLPTPRIELHQPEGQLLPGKPAAGPGRCWSAALAPFAAAGRQRLYLQPPAPASGGSGSSSGGGDGVMLTYRVLLNRGSFHLVMFRDRQPPFVIQNATRSAIEVGYFPPTEAADGSFTYNGPLSALRVGPRHTLECDFRAPSSQAGGGATGAASPRKSGSSGGSGGSSGWEDQEDEDAFLDCLLREELQAASQELQRPPPVLKFRPAGSKEWQHPCVLLPGLHLAAASSTAGGGGGSTECAAGALLSEVHISKCCATTRILLLPGSEAALAAAAAASPAAEPLHVQSEAEREQEGQPLPLWIEVQCRQLQVCLWDDERQRLLPSGSSAAPPALGRELFSLSLDRLSLLVARQQYLVAAGPAAASAAGAALRAGSVRPVHPWQRQVLQVMAAQLTAAAVQVDSFLPGSEQPVLLTSLPAEDVGAARQQRQGPPLQLALEVHHCVPQPQGALAALGVPLSSAAGSGGGQMSLRNTWVHDLLVQLPTLAVAADDSLLLFVDRLSGLLSAGAGHDSSGGVAGRDGSGAAQAAGGSRGAAQAPGGSAAGSRPDGSAMQQAGQLELLQQGLAAEAAGAAASRLYIEQAVVESVRLLLDAHIAAGTAGVPVAVDTYRAPVTLSRIAAHDVLFRPHILVRGLMAHGVAEAVLNAPQVLGSLSLLFNPTGLVQSVRAGVSDLIGLPLAALQNQSLAQFISGVGQGSVSLVKHTLGWTLTSISGFSQAFSRAVDSAVTLRSSSAAAGGGTGALAHRPPPSHLGHGLTQGLAGLAEGVAAGITGVVRAPLQGYSSGSGVLGGIGRGLLGAVGLPVSGALELVGSVSAGLASSAGVVHVPQPRRSGRFLLTAPDGSEAEAEGAPAAGMGGSAPPADAAAPVVAAAARLMQHPALLGHFLVAASSSAEGAAGTAGLGRYQAHAPLQSATVLQGAEGLRSAHFARGFALRQPVLLVAEHAAVLFSAGGLEAVLVVPLALAEVEVRYSSHELRFFSHKAAPAGRPAAAAAAAVLCRLNREGWLRLAPLLRKRCAAARTG